MCDNKEEMHGKPGPTKKVHWSNLALGNNLMLPWIVDNFQMHAHVLFGGAFTLGNLRGHDPKNKGKWFYRR